MSNTIQIRAYQTFVDYYQRHGSSREREYRRNIIMRDV